MGEKFDLVVIRTQIDLAAAPDAARGSMMWLEQREARERLPKVASDLLARVAELEAALAHLTQIAEGWRKLWGDLLDEKIAVEDQRDAARADADRLRGDAARLTRQMVEERAEHDAEGDKLDAEVAALRAAAEEARGHLALEFDPTDHAKHATLTLDAALSGAKPVEGTYCDHGAPHGPCPACEAMDPVPAEAPAPGIETPEATAKRLLAIFERTHVYVEDLAAEVHHDREAIRKALLAEADRDERNGGVLALGIETPGEMATRLHPRGEGFDQDWRPARDAIVADREAIRNAARKLSVDHRYKAPMVSLVDVLAVLDAGSR